MTSINELIHEIDDGGVPDAKRRELLLTATGVVGGIGLLAAAYPFVASFAPSERARALGGPITADVATLEVGKLRVTAWRGKPIWLMRRSEEMVRALMRPDPELVDPLSEQSEQPSNCTNPTRSLRPDLFVAIGVCTHLGCTPILHLDNAELNAELHAPGGFICPCHGSRFDLAGRVVKNMPAPINLEIPGYRFTSATTLEIG